MSLLQNEETMKTFLDTAKKEYERFKSDRDTIGFDEKMKVADGMWRCFTNRSLADTEQARSSKAPDTRADIGSVRHFRMVNQKASLGHAVASSVEIPWKYKTVANPEIWGSAVEAASQAAIHNVLAKHAWKNGKGGEKLYEFFFQIHKYCNVPVQVIWHKDIRKIALKDMKTGKISWKEKEINVFPTFEVLHWSMVYGDIYCKNIADQQCLIVLSVVPWMKIQQGVKAKWYDKEQVAKLRSDLKAYRWDGSEGATARIEQAENAGNSAFNPGESDLFLKWDVYQWAPIDGEAYSDEADYKLYWSTVIGNDLAKGIPVRMDKDFDPDGEIPIKMIKVIPDDVDMFYSMSWSEAVRAMYSIECTLWEQTIDNISGVNNPMLLFDPTRFQSKPEDLSYKPGAKHQVDDVDKAMKEFVPRDTTAQTAQLIKLVQSEEGVSASINQNMMGEANGGRTPASESLAINRFSQQPNLGETSYVLKQLVGFIAQKYKSYYQAFAKPTMIKMIADEELDHPLYGDEPGYNIYGDFDVAIDVVDEFVEDFVQAGQELQLLQAVAGNPALLQSKSHRIDVGKWITSIMRRMKTHNVDDIVLPGKSIDAALRQRDEIRRMIETNEYIAPQENEDHEEHLTVINAEIMRWAPVLDAKIDPASGELVAQQTRAVDVINLLLVPHRDAHQAFLDQAGQAAQIPEAAAEQTPGQMAGNVPAGMLGGMVAQ
jgi:hypothetical protein